MKLPPNTLKAAWDISTRSPIRRVIGSISGRLRPLWISAGNSMLKRRVVTPNQVKAAYMNPSRMMVSRVLIVWCWMTLEALISSTA